MRLTSSTVEIKGLRWKGSLGLLITFTFAEKAAGPQNKAMQYSLESPQQWEPSDGATGAICWRFLSPELGS